MRESPSVTIMMLLFTCFARCSRVNVSSNCPAAESGSVTEGYRCVRNSSASRPKVAASAITCPAVPRPTPMSHRSLTITELDCATDRAFPAKIPGRQFSVRQYDCHSIDYNRRPEEQSMRRCVLSLLVSCCMLPAQTKKVIANLSPDMVKELAVSAPNVKIVPARGPELAKEIEDADAMVGVTLTPELFKHARQLKWLHISSAGVESHGRQVGLFPELVESNVVVTNAKNVYGPQIADHAFAFVTTT